MTTTIRKMLGALAAALLLSPAVLSADSQYAKIAEAVDLLASKTLQQQETNLEVRGALKQIRDGAAVLQQRMDKLERTAADRQKRLEELERTIKEKSCDCSKILANQSGIDALVMRINALEKRAPDEEIVAPVRSDVLRRIEEQTRRLKAYEDNVKEPKPASLK